MNLDRFKLLSEIFGIWVTIIGVASAGTFAFLEYKDHEKSEQLKNTMEMLNKFNNERYYSARQKIAISEYASVDALNDVLSKKSGSVANYNKFTLNRIKKDGLNAKLNDIIIILENIAICSRANICDYDSTIAFFFDYGRNFFRTYYPYICLERKNWSDYSIGMVLEQFYNPTSNRNVCS